MTAAVSGIVLKDKSLGFGDRRQYVMNEFAAGMWLRDGSNS